MNPITNLETQIIELQSLLVSLQKLETYPDKLALLTDLPGVQHYLQHTPRIQTFIKSLVPEVEYVVKSVLAIGQGPIIFNMHHTNDDRLTHFLLLLEQLLDVEIFYQHLGGIIGYHVTLLRLIVSQQKTAPPSFDHTRYIHPEGLYLGHDHPKVRQAVRWGIENTQHLAAIYPLGGAGDRLNLKDEITGHFLPAALLPFLGRTLLEGLIRDLQVQEYLSFKLFGKQHLTPVAIMTSTEKNNHTHILNICKACKWFGRSPDSFYFFLQPLVPVITIEGNWSLSGPLTLTLKPCGHGVLWKLAEEQGVFTWLEAQGRHQCLIRQINNPLAGTDNSLLGLTGIGSHDHKAFGFVSCERLLRSDEGTNVLIETQHEHCFEYRLTNIEYTDFAQRGIGEVPAQPGSCFSIYPANTNILFADIPSIREALKICPIPGKLINMKSKVPYINPQGEKSFISGGRLESTMQNIADFLVDHFPHPLTPEQCKDALKTFIVYNSRSKTISTTKKLYQPGESSIATPEQAYYDLLSNHYKLLQQCRFELPLWNKLEDYLLEGPSCIFLFHPALGPLYSIIEQKIRHGRLAPGAELQLEIAEVDIEDLSLEGSLLVEAVSPLGTSDLFGFLQYGQESRCTLRHVTIRNQGIQHDAVQTYWKNAIKRRGEVKIVLHEGAEFHAEHILLEGSHYFEVPAYHRLMIQAEPQGGWTKKLSPIQKPTWSWHYAFDDQNAIQLKKISTL